jgi:hypothetical protein
MNNLNQEEWLIELFVLLLNEFFDSLDEYIDITKIDNDSAFIVTGINIIRNIFEYTLIKKKNTINLKFYSQRSIYYYLEYIKQLQENGIYFDINYNKASIFLYNKILDEINSTDNNTLKNLLSLDDKEDIKELDIKTMLSELNIFLNNLFNWNINTKISEYKFICKNNLKIIGKNYKNIKIINQYITLLKEKVEITKDDNTKIITNTCKTITNNKKKVNEYNNIIKKFYINIDILKDKYKTMKLNEFTNWLICYNNS